MTNELAVLADRVEAPRDKTGRPILVGDVLKVYHFRGARWRKQYFMYKQVVGTKTFGQSDHPYLAISHLGLKSVDDCDGGYYMRQDGARHPDIEIVQGLDWHHDRSRIPTPPRIEEGE